jgi:hypothetical protein
MPKLRKQVEKIFDRHTNDYGEIGVDGKNEE